MSQDNIQTIIQKLDKYHEDREEKHKLIMDEINSLKNQITPMSEIYVSLKGFGKVAIWVGKWIMTPTIILLGAIVSIKKIMFG